MTFNGIIMNIVHTFQYNVNNHFLNTERVIAERIYCFCLELNDFQAISVGAGFILQITLLQSHHGNNVIQQEFF